MCFKIIVICFCYFNFDKKYLLERYRIKKYNIENIHDIFCTVVYLSYIQSRYNNNQLSSEFNNS